MAIKRIDELGAATPLLTDFLPATPAGGPSTKATIQQILDANVLQPLTITYTGPSPFPPVMPLTQRTSTQTGATVVIPTGVSAGAIVTIANSGTLTISLPDLSSATSMSLSGLPLLTSVSCAALVNVAGSFQFSALGSLTSSSFPLLYSAGSFSLNSLGIITSLSFPSLYSPNSFSVSSCALLSSLSIPALYYCAGSFSLATLASLASISAPSLSLATSIVISSCASLTSVDLPAIETLLSATSISLISGTAALTTFTIGSTLKRVEGSVVLSSCALLVASVDSILVRLAALDGTGGTTAYSSKTVTITGTSATPSATGLSAKSTLVARGCTVTNN